jgi:GMC oxidoreductase
MLTAYEQPDRASGSRPATFKENAVMRGGATSGIHWPLLPWSLRGFIALQFLLLTGYALAVGGYFMGALDGSPHFPLITNSVGLYVLHGLLGDLSILQLFEIPAAAVFAVWTVYRNLYVCDASVFPTSVTVNPELTVMALAEYPGRRMLGAAANGSS